jgi:hypothetical protein
MGLFSSIIGGVVGFFIGGPVGAAIGAGIGATKVGDKIVNKVLEFVTKPFLGAFGVPNDGAGNAQREEGVVITKQGGGTVNIPVVYGFRQVGGVITFATTGSDKNKYLWVAYVLSEGPVEGIHQLLIDDNDITTPEIIGALNRGEQVNVTTGKYKDRVKMQFWYGKQYGTNASSSPVGDNAFMKEAPGWRTTDAYNGLATLFVRYEWRQVTTQEDADNNPFTGQIPMVKVNLLGRRVLPIDGTAQSRDYITDVNAGRERYSTNPADILLDYLRNPFYGKGLSNTEIDWDSFEKARDKYNQDVTYVNGVKGPILTCNMVLDTGATLMSNVKTILQGCRSYMPYVQGTYKLRVEDAGNPTDILSGSAVVAQTFTPDNIVGDIAWGGVPRDSVYTEYEVTYVDPLNKWATNTATYPTTEAERLEYQVIDGGRVNKGSTTLPTITNYAMAYDMARLLFFKSRTQETLNLKVTSQAMELEPGDNIQVEGNILTFQTGPSATPWRIVSIRANDDYSFDLGCVLNPDSIYPHARAGERDIILPPYIPKYESIIYPYTDYDLSLYPPSFAYIGGGTITSPLNPPGATDPTGPTGGGVGDQNGEQNQNPVTVPPPPPPAVVEVFNHYIQIDKASYTANGNLVSADIEFLQPDSPSYAGVDFWFKRNISTETTYRLVTNTDIPGSGRLVRHTISGLIKGSTPYTVIARVKYTNGNSSTVITRFALNVNGAVSTENPADFEEIVQSGWAPPSTTPNPTQKDTLFDFIQARPTYASAGVPTSDRGLNIIVSQDINASAFTDQIKGVKIYYKQTSASGFKSHTEYFDSSYFPGETYTFTPALDLGVRTYPNPDDSTDNYDFVFRFVYADGGEGTRQIRFVNADIENTTDAVVFGFGIGSGSPVLALNELSTAYTPQPEDPASVVDTREIEINVKTTGNALSGNFIVWEINPPDISNRSNWYGVRVRTRTVPLGGGNASNFETVDYLPVNQPTAGIWQIRHPVNYDVEYQFVLTPIVRYSGAKTEAYRSILQQGKIHNRQSALDYPSNGDWTSRMKMQTINTSEVSTIQTTPFPTSDPIAVINLWRKVFKFNTTNNTPNNVYFELEYNVSHVVGLSGVRIYRRSNTGSGYGTITNNLAKYYNYGRWEYVDVVPGTNATTLASGNVLVNLRGPIGHEEFNSAYQVPTASATARANLLNALGQWAAVTNKKILRTLSGSLGNSTTPATGWDYVVVVSTSGGTSAQCVRLPVIAGTATTTTELPQTVPLVTYDGFDAGYQRNITPDTNNGSRASLANGNLLTTNSSSATYTAPTANRGSAII